MPLQPFAGADPFVGRLPGRTAVLSYLDHRLGPDGPGRLPSAAEWPARLRLSDSGAPQVLSAAVRAIALLAEGRDVPHTSAKVMPSTSGPVAWCEGPTWAIIGSAEGPILGLVDNRPGICFDLAGEDDATQAIELLIATLVHERERALEMEPLTRPALRGLPPLTA
jgi:hypothetical protein